MQIVFASLVILWCTSFTIYSQELVRPKKMTFSYVNHPVIVAELIPIIQKAYDSLGIKTEFVEQPSNRNLRAIKNGLVDGDVVFSRLLLKDYPEFVLVEPPLVSSVFVVLCQPHLTCDASILRDPKKLLVSTAASQSGVNRWYGKQLEISFYLINNLAVIPQLITEKRFEYGVYILTEELMGKVDKLSYRFFELFRTDSFHILHPKYQFLKDDVEQAISQVIAESNVADQVDNDR
ncbi:MAG: hypothetical protein NWQ54_13455 [Paraglaciecola sp.]|uniref:hypothetical protein n=1 Tax=Paraglaciecola sp. TaxID=1920173 RepID=UPI002740202E|nr:hypothetical protein [Paraglaciecola sp.]MDP5031670.1 hypothetical protein [Paraglaciecola sp.]MDP5131888.1 hypothetical protein [Paraglaciecola sp.]